jgi:hypothetical protein
MEPTKIEDAHFFKRNLDNDTGLSNHRSEQIHREYQAFINTNYVLKDEVTHIDHIINTPELSA